MNKEKVETRLASDKLLATALELLENGELSSREKIMLALQLDARDDLLECKKSISKINDHPFHKLTIKGVGSVVTLLLSLIALSSWVFSLL